MRLKSTTEPAPISVRIAEIAITESLLLIPSSVITKLFKNSLVWDKKYPGQISSTAAEINITSPRFCKQEIRGFVKQRIEGGVFGCHEGQTPLNTIEYVAVNMSAAGKSSYTRVRPQ